MNNTTNPSSIPIRTECRTVVELLRFRAESQPSRRAYSFALDGRNDEAHLTYEALDRRARAIAANLQRTLVKGDRALLLYPPGLDFVAAFFGALYAGVIAVPAPPPRTNGRSGGATRCAAIAADAEVQAVVSTSALQASVSSLSSTASTMPPSLWLATDEIASGQAAEWVDPQPGDTEVALLQYTSGSTASPKGVVVSHKNLLDNSALIQHAFENNSDSQGVIWLPPYHDMGLVGGLLQPLYCGFPVTLMSPARFLMHPVKWLELISRKRATVSGGPNFAYDLCVTRTTPAQRDQLDLSSWELAFVGAEPVRPETLRRFSNAFHSTGFRPHAFYPCYGLAEATLLVSGGKKSRPPVEGCWPLDSSERMQVGRHLVGCGGPLSDSQIVIVDPDSKILCPHGQIGEIWVSGPSVALGYWNRPQETANTFAASISDSGDGPFLRSGDLGFIRDGELFVTGRRKDLIIIRGRNEHPEDIERTVDQSHPAIQPNSTAAFSADIGGQERLIIAAELDRRYFRVETVKDVSQACGERAAEPLFDDVIGAVREAVADAHDLRADCVLLLEPNTIPRTSSGKIPRHACRTQFIAGTLQVIAKS